MSSWLVEALQQPCPIWLLASTFLTPFLIAYLVHLPNTRSLRLLLWGYGSIGLIWSALTVQLDPLINLRVGATGGVWIWGFSTIWAFARYPPKYHPLPRQTLFPFLRRLLPIKAIELVYDAHRLIGVAPFTGPYRTYPGRYPRIRAIAYHFFWAMLGFFMFDLFCYVPFRLAPKTFGSTNYVGGDFSQWCHDVSAQFGVPVLVLRIFFAACLGGMTHFGITSLYHMLALIGTASGYYTPEEWPDATDWPILSTSLNDLWGKRWHQLMRIFFTTVAKPFEGLPKPLYLMTIFAISAIYHIFIYYPRRQELIIYPYALFYLSSGLGCILERAFRQYTGKRVGGVWGFIWVWTFLFIVGQPTVDSEYGTGWVGVMRDVFAKEPEKSMVCWAVYALGWGPHPSTINAGVTMKE